MCPHTNGMAPSLFHTHCCWKFIAVVKFRLTFTLCRKFIRGRTFENIHFEICCALMSIKAASILSASLPIERSIQFTSNSLASSSRNHNETNLFYDKY